MCFTTHCSNLLECGAETAVPQDWHRASHLTVLSATSAGSAHYRSYGIWGPLSQSILQPWLAMCRGSQCKGRDSSGSQWWANYLKYLGMTVTKLIFRMIWRAEYGTYLNKCNGKMKYFSALDMSQLLRNF
jgi:hypothetical protein